MATASVDLLSSIVNDTILKVEEETTNVKAEANTLEKDVLLFAVNQTFVKDELEKLNFLSMVEDEHQVMDFGDSIYETNTKQEDALYIDNDKNFINQLPHITGVCEDAVKYGRPYLPTNEMAKIVDGYWNTNNRKKKYLGYLCGNFAINAFVSNTIDATTCIGFLRSRATAFGYPGLKCLAEMCLSTSSNNSFTVPRKQMMAATFPEEMRRRPSTIQQMSETCQVYKKLANKNTVCVTMDWSEASKKINYDYSRKVCLLQNLIVIILLPAYTMDVILDTDRELERYVLASVGQQDDRDKYKYNQQTKEEKKNLLDDLCVLSAMSYLYTFFSGDGKDDKSIHLYNAPLRLPPFDDHPVINLHECPYFSDCGETARRKVVASISTPSQSMVTLNHRVQRTPLNNVNGCKDDKEQTSDNTYNKLIGVTNSGIEVRVVKKPTATQSSCLRKKKREVKHSRLAQKLGEITRDPVTHMNRRERPLFLRSMLALCGSYGWFSIVLGYNPTLDVLFMGNDHDGLFSPHWIRRFRKRYVSMTPMRNRKIDLRFHGLELADTPGNACAFRIRPASLCNSNDVYQTSPKTVKKRWTLNVLQGNRNPFFTRLLNFNWYNPSCMSDIFGDQPIYMEQHVAVFDNCLDMFSNLVRGTANENRWKANLLDKREVFNSCIFSLIIRLKCFCQCLHKKHKDIEIKKKLKNVRQLRGLRAQTLCRETKQLKKLCTKVESSIIGAMEFNRNMGNEKEYNTNKNKKRKVISDKKLLQKTVASDMDALSVCYMLYDECDMNYQRFEDAEVRETAFEMVREMYRVSARLHLKDLLMRGTKMSLTWQKPYNPVAEATMSNIPRCRIPWIVHRFENRTLNEKMSTLQILETRDQVYRPIRHTLLQLVFGEKMANYVSVVTCFQWMDWCLNGVNKPEEYYWDVNRLVDSRKKNQNNNCLDTDIDNKRRNNKRNRDDLTRESEIEITNMSDIEIINMWLNNDTKDLPYGTLNGSIINKHWRRKKSSSSGDSDDDLYENENCNGGRKSKVPVVGGDFINYVIDSDDSSNTNETQQLKGKVHKHNKRNTGRMGFRDVYMICLISLPVVIHEKCKKIIRELYLETSLFFGL
uniref:Wsv226-like protein n=1 Tax=Pasiphaea japonica whispovirus TaxID=2984286 RepID=A0A9C7EZC5_9VIRU|nr:MAG: wsv226-like protein [Pasiphaea japonica whispovirus]